MEKEKVCIGNKFLNIKKRVNGSYYLDGNSNIIVFIIVFIPIFLIALLVSRSFIFSLISTVILYIFTMLVIFINNYFGKKMHAKIFQKQIFQNLIMKGFKKEKIGKYEGLLMEKDGRSIRVFYDWNKYAGGIVSFGDIVIDVFYQPQLFKKENEKNALLKLDKLTKKYDRSFWTQANRVIFTNYYVKLYSNYYPWTSSNKIEKKIEFALKILNENNLEPFSLNEIDNSKYKIYKEQHHFYPNMPHLWDYVEDMEKENKT